MTNEPENVNYNDIKLNSIELTHEPENVNYKEIKLNWNDLTNGPENVNYNRNKVELNWNELTNEPENVNWVISKLSWIELKRIDKIIQTTSIITKSLTLHCSYVSDPANLLLTRPVRPGALPAQIPTAARSLLTITSKLLENECSKIDEIILCNNILFPYMCKYRCVVCYISFPHI